MKVIVKKDFRDLGNFATVHKQGSEVEFSDERAKYLIDLGVCEKTGTDDAVKLAAEKAAAEKAETEKLAAEKAAKIASKQPVE